MLTPLKREEFERYVDLAYALALDPARSGYPTYTDGFKTRADFVERSRLAFERENEEILLYMREGRAAGWIHYYFLPGDRYLDTCSFCIAEGMGDAADEFTAFARERFPGYESCIWASPGRTSGRRLRWRPGALSVSSGTSTTCLTWTVMSPGRRTRTWCR